MLARWSGDRKPIPDRAPTPNGRLQVAAPPPAGPDQATGWLPDARLRANRAEPNRAGPGGAGEKKEPASPPEEAGSGFTLAP